MRPGQIEAPVEAPELSPTDQVILDALAQESLGRGALLASLGYTQRTGNFKKALGKLISASLIEMTIPDKPNSRLQKYRLADAGKHLLKSMQE